ncbi:hypothetical protein BMF89_01645 [Arthrobacter sp. SRS-W-1-2016]|nr:hypothetical protein BMF89_01645 [Arthrobacter sp. SRS-W-1-2016]
MGPGLVNRDNPVFIKIATDNRTGKIPGLISLAKDAGDLVAAGVHILKAGMSVEDVATSLAPYLTTAERIKIAAQSYSSDISCLSVGQDGG